MQWIQFDAHAKEAEDLLYTSFNVYEHLETRSLSVACSEYHLPVHVREHVDYITPGIRLRTDPGRRKRKEHDHRAATHRSRGIQSMVIPNGRLPGLPKLNNSTCASYVTNLCLSSESK